MSPRARGSHILRPGEFRNLGSGECATSSKNEACTSLRTNSCTILDHNHDVVFNSGGTLDVSIEYGDESIFSSSMKLTWYRASRRVSQTLAGEG